MLSMFVRVKSSPRSPRKSVQIVESKRVGTKVRQRVIQHIGVANDEAELEELKLFAGSVKAKLESDGALPLYDPDDLDVMSSTTTKKAAALKENADALPRREYEVNLLDLILKKIGL